MKSVRKAARKGLPEKLALLAPILLLSACGGAAPARQPAPQVVTGLHVETVEPQTIPNEVAAPGTIAAIRTAQIAARVMSTVTQVAVHEGDRVRKAQLLITLDDRELAAHYAAAQAGLRESNAGLAEAQKAVAAAQAQADVAEKTYQRYLYLQREKSVSPQEFDEVQSKERAAQAALAQAQAGRQRAQASFQQAQAGLQAASIVLGYARIVAPFDGVVLQRLVDPGTTAMPGTPLLVVEDTSHYRLEATIGADSATGLRRSMPARVQLDAFPGKNVAGIIEEIEPGADPASHTVQLKIALPADPAIRSGAFGRAWLLEGQRSAIIVPASAILDRGQLRAVYAVGDGGMIRFRLVTLGATVGSGREVLSGLGPGDRVVTDPGSADLDGKRMEAGR